MTNSPYVRSALAQAALEHTPPLIRKTLLKESAFREEYGFNADAVLTLGDSGISIQRSALFDAIRNALSDIIEVKVSDTKGRTWKVINESNGGELPTLTISRLKRRHFLPDFAALSPYSNTRLHSLTEAAFNVHLPTDSLDSWRGILSERALDDDEFDELHSDFSDTPVHFSQSIRDQIEKGKSSVSSLVPLSRRYFDRLVGAYDGSGSIRDYAAGTGRQVFEQLSAWQPYDGFLFSLFLSSHAALTAEISVGQLGSEDILHAFEFLEAYGDRISQLGAIEVGLRILPERPEIEPVIIRIVQRIRDDDVDGNASHFKLLSALFVLVDGELSRTRLLSSAPPFFRRLASLSQAALIHRQLVNLSVEIDVFCEWAFNSRGEQYYFQSLTDMRLEPRWNPDLGVASQMKADFFGRIMIAAKNYEMNIKGSKLYNLILGTEPTSLLSTSHFPYPYFPGPLEGNEDNPNTLPIELSDAIEAQLSAEEVGPSSFIALVNSALIFRVESGQAELAAKALKVGSYRLANVEDKSQLVSILNGLATVAAVTRSCSLADELRILVRRYRHDVEFRLSIEEAIWICLVAAASRGDLNDWREFSGEWLTELAFADFKGNEGQALYSHLQCLLHAVQALWITCGRADAALLAYNASKPAT